MRATAAADSGPQAAQAGEQPDMLAAALWYAEDWRKPILPLHGIGKGKCTCGDPECKSPGKHPANEHGCRDASTDPAVIRAWFQRWPYANIGLACGEPSGVDVLDVDPRHYGNETLFELEQKHGELPRTVMGISGSLGPHIYFQHADGIRNSAGIIGEGLDVRTTGGLVVLPPSLHISGRRYCWEGASHPSETPIAAFPEWLLKLARGRANGNGTGSTAPPVPDKIPHGTQHHTLVSFGGTMRRRGADEEEIFAALWAMNTRRCEKPGSEKDVRKMARSLCNNYAPDPKANVSNANGHARQPEPIVRPVALSVADVLCLQALPHQELIEKTLPVSGAFLIVGTHKSGKTVFAVQAAIAVASGHPFMDNYRVLDKGGVILVEQDDPAGDLSMKSYLEASPVPVSGIPLYLFVRIPYTFGLQFIQWLESEIQEKQARLVILDSYTALRPHRKPGTDIVKVESDEMRLLNALGKKHNCLIATISHDSKGSFGMDWSDRTAGTYAMGAAVEGQLHISRFRDLLDKAPERLVHIRMRHGADYQSVVRFRVPTLDYETVIEGEAASMFPELLGIYSEFGDRPFSPKDLYQSTGVSRATASRNIARLKASGALSRRGTGDYAIAREFLPVFAGRGTM